MRGEAVGNIKNKRVQNPLKIRSLKPLDDPTIKSVKVSVVEMLLRLIEPVGMYSITDATLLNECANYTTNKDLDRIGFCTKKLLNHVFSIRILSIFINKFITFNYYLIHIVISPFTYITMFIIILYEFTISQLIISQSN